VRSHDHSLFGMIIAVVLLVKRLTPTQSRESKRTGGLDVVSFAWVDAVSIGTNDLPKVGFFNARTSNPQCHRSLPQ
jgi:hypothetical protein